MPRPPRLQIEGATYHVMARGNRKQCIFRSDRDRHRFLEILANAALRYGVLILGFSLMSNHFHLVVTTPRGNISAFMRQVDGVYTQYANWRHKEVGHLFQGRFKAVLIDYDLHLLTALSYVFMNPVDAGLVAAPCEWPWSSYRATIGLMKPPDFLSLGWLDDLFPAASRRESSEMLVGFMAGPRTIDSYLGQTAAGSDAFKERIRDFIAHNLYMSRVPRSYKRLFRPPLDQLLAHPENTAHRDLVIQRAHVIHGYTLTEIADALELHPTSVCRLLRRLEEQSRERARRMSRNGT